MNTLPSKRSEAGDEMSLKLQLADAVRAMDAWLQPRYLDGRAVSDPSGRIELAASVTHEFVFGELGGRAFMGCDERLLRWCHRIPWARLTVPAQDRNGPQAVDFEFDGAHTGRQLTGRAMRSFVLSMIGTPSLFALLRQHAQLDLRLHEARGVSRAILASLPIKLRMPPPPLSPYSSCLEGVK